MASVLISRTEGILMHISHCVITKVQMLLIFSSYKYGEKIYIQNSLRSETTRSIITGTFFAL